MILWSNFEEGGRTKEEGEMICGVWNEECGMWNVECGMWNEE